MRIISSSKLNRTITHQYSPWHSPIPYLFGGLGAILGVMGFALLVLACSYWKLSWHHHQDGAHSDDLDDDDNKEGDPGTKEPINKAYEEKILVIMAGNDKPTFLATPVCPNCHNKEIDNNHVLVPALAAASPATPHENEGYIFTT